MSWIFIRDIFFVNYIFFIKKAEFKVYYIEGGGLNDRYSKNVF